MNFSKIMKYAAVAAFAFLISCSTNSSSSDHDHDHEAEAHEHAGDDHDHDDHDSHEGHHHGPVDPTAIELSAAQMKAVDIRLGQMERKEIGVTFNANGVLATDPAGSAGVAPFVDGVVKRMAVRRGDRVRRGQLIATIEAPEVLTMQQDYAEALASERLAAQTLERQQRLADAGAGVAKNLQQARTEADIARARSQALAARLRTLGIDPVAAGRGEFSPVLSLTAPIAGVVTECSASTGSFADMRTPLVTIVDNSSLYASLSIFEKDIDRVSQGDKVELRLTNHSGDARLEGRVERINRAVDPRSRTLEVRVAILPASSGAMPELIAGTPVTATLHSGCEVVDALPEGAVVNSEGHDYIFMLTGKHGEGDAADYHFERIAIERGEREGGYIHVIFPADVASRITPESTFVVGGAFYLGSMTSSHGEHVH